MSTHTDKPGGHDPAQREALEQAQRHAAKHQPENFKDEETDTKVVEIGPDLDDDPIKGIDPATPGRSAA